MTGGRWSLAAVGACAGAAAALTQGTVAGGVAWAIALAVACAGLGIAFERLTRQRLSVALTVTAGLALLLTGSLVLARLGWLNRAAQLAAVVAGIAATAMSRTSPRAGAGDAAGPGIAPIAALGGGAALVVLALPLVHPGAPDDGWNRVFQVKRLWDLGTLAGESHRSALAVVGDAYAAWASGAEAAGGFGAGLCAALVIFVVACELSAAETGFARLAFALVVLSIVLRPVRGAEWPAVVFHLSAVLSLRGPIAEQRIAWHTLLAAIALGLVRNEYWLLATPYAFAALVLPRLGSSWERIAIGLASWFGTAVAILLAMGVHVGAAVAKAIAILGGLPLAGLVLRMLGNVHWRSMLGVMCAAVVSYQLAIASRAMPPAMHAADAVFATWFAVGIAAVIAIARPEPPAPAPWIRTGAAALAIAVIALAALGLPMFRSTERARIAARFTGAITAWRHRVAFGAGRTAGDVHAAQLRVPAGAAIAFWGTSAARLEFRRNPIRDVSRDSRGAVTAVTAARLRGLTWLIVEDIPSSQRRDPWTRTRSRTPALVTVRDRVELHGAIGNVGVYRIRGSDAATSAAP